MDILPNIQNGPVRLVHRGNSAELLIGSLGTEVNCVHSQFALHKTQVLLATLTFGNTQQFLQ